MANRVIAGAEVFFSANTTQLKKSLKETEAAFNRLNRSTRRAQNFIAGIGVTAGFFALGRVVINAVNTFREFENQMAEVRAITSATDEQFKRLSDNAIALGRSTVFTATQVGQLQVAYGRLGFSTDEILNATQATLDLAAATNIDLASAAEVAGSTLRAFNLDAVETQRVTDVMAASLNTSALTVDAFRESMKFVAPVANAAGASIEETSALLAVLANNGLKGSIAGTSLRRIFSDMTRDGRPLQDRLDELAKRGLSLGEAFDEIGRVSQTALLVLTKNTDAVKDYAEALKNVEGETARIRDIRLDTLEGDIVRLTSAWQGFLISSQQGFSGYRIAVQQLTKSFNDLVGEVSAVQTVLPLLIKEIKLDSLGFFADQLIEDLKAARAAAQQPIDESFVLRLATQAKLSSEQLERLKGIVKGINEELTPKESGIQKFTTAFGDIKSLEKTKENYDKITAAVTQYTDQVNRNILATGRLFKDGDLTGEEAARRIKLWNQEEKAVKEYAKSILLTFSPEVITGLKELDVTYEDLQRTLKQLNSEFETRIEKNNTKELEQIGERIKQVKAEMAEIDKYRETVKKTAKELASLRDYSKVPIFSETVTRSAIQFLKDAQVNIGYFIDKLGFLQTSLVSVDGVMARFNKTMSQVAGGGQGGVIRDRITGIENEIAKGGPAEKIQNLREELEKLQGLLGILTGQSQQFGLVWAQNGQVFFDVGAIVMGFAQETLKSLSFAVGQFIGGLSKKEIFAGLLNNLASMLSQLGEMAISAGTTVIAIKKSIQTLNGPLAIAAGVALLALAGYVSSRARAIGTGGGGSSSSISSGGGSSSFAFAQDSIGINLSAETIIRGQDLYVVLSNYEKNSRNTRNG
jgi:hypothetical protein